MDATAAHQQSSRTCREHAALKASREAMRALSEPRHLTPPPHTLSKCKERTERRGRPPLLPTDRKQSNLRTCGAEPTEPSRTAPLERGAPLGLQRTASRGRPGCSLADGCFSGGWRFESCGQQSVSETCFLLQDAV